MTSKIRPRQVMHRATKKFAAPTRVNVARIEKWQPFWEDETISVPRPRLESTAHNEDHAIQLWLENVLRTARDLLLASDFPCFEHIRLRQWSRSDVTGRDGRAVLNVEIEQPAFESYARGTFDASIDEAITWVEYMMTHDPEPEHRENLWTRIENRSLTRIAGDNRVNHATFRVILTAYEKGCPFLHLGQNVYQIGWGSNAKIVNRSTGPDDPTFSVRLTKYKETNTELLRRAGLPAPEHHLVNSLEAARKAREKIGATVVVKPADLERGEGVTMDVGPDTLDEAVSAALEMSPAKKVLVERQVAGVCCRIFVTGGRVLYAVNRHPIGVFGDGKRTVEALVSAELAAQGQKPSWRRKEIRPIDDLAREALQSAGLSPESVPDKDRFVALRRIESTAWGGVDEEVTNDLHPEIARIAIEAASVCGLNTAGVDIITDDVSRHWKETGAIVNEVNFSPSLGSSVTSRRCLPEYFDRLMQGDGLIPVAVFVGDHKATEAAMGYLQDMKRQGKSGYLTSDTETRDATGGLHSLAIDGLPERVQALILSRKTQALAIVVHSDALLDGFLPLEGVDAVHFINTPTLSGEGENRRKRGERLSEMLSSWVWKTR